MSHTYDARGELVPDETEFWRPKLTEKQQAHKAKIIWQRRVLRFCKDHDLKYCWLPGGAIEVQGPENVHRIEQGGSIKELKEEVGCGTLQG